MVRIAPPTPPLSSTLHLRKSPVRRSGCAVGSKTTLARSFSAQPSVTAPDSHHPGQPRPRLRRRTAGKVIDDGCAGSWSISAQMAWSGTFWPQESRWTRSPRFSAGRTPPPSGLPQPQGRSGPPGLDDRSPQPHLSNSRRVTAGSPRPHRLRRAADAGCMATARRRGSPRWTRECCVRTSVEPFDLGQLALGRDDDRGPDPPRHHRFSLAVAGWEVGSASGRWAPPSRRPNARITGTVHSSGTTSQIGRCAHQAGVGWLGGR
jgi:hypothetical protein